MWRVYGLTGLAGQQVRGTPLRETKLSGRDLGGIQLAVTCFQTFWGCCSLQVTSNPGSVPRVSYPRTGADKPEATSADQDTWKW